MKHHIFPCMVSGLKEGKRRGRGRGREGKGRKEEEEREGEGERRGRGKGRACQLVQEWSRLSCGHQEALCHGRGVK